MCLIVRLHPGAGSAFRSLAHTSSPPGAAAPADLPVIDDDSTLVFSTPAPPVPVRIPAATARPESSLAEGPKIGLEVARYIVRERARVESRRLTAKGLNAYSRPF